MILSGSYSRFLDDADMKTDGCVAGGQRDNHADQPGPRDEGSAMGEKDTGFGGRVLSLVGGTGVLFSSYRRNPGVA